MILDTDRLRDDAAYLEDMRQRFLRDHFFAAELLGFRDFKERPHRPAVNLYFPKNPDAPIPDQHPKKKRLHLDPRKTFKTSLNRVDSVQWICAFPETATILNESATQPLAVEICSTIGNVFYVGKNKPSSALLLLYPHLALSKRPTNAWNTPNRRYEGLGDLDYTMDFTSPQSSQSGWHPWMKKSDDVEDADNSGIDVGEGIRQHVISKCDQNENVIRDGGYNFITGTRYHPFDYYGACLKRAEANPDNWETLVRCSIKLKSGGRILPGEFPPEDECELQFPEFFALSYKALKEIYHDKYESFMCQQQNDPTGGAIPRFEEKLYNSCVVPETRLPRAGKTYICWRPRYGGHKAMAKYSEGAAARITPDGKIVILDAYQGSYTPSGEAEKIVHQCYLHGADGLMIVDVPGSDYVMTHVRNEALRKNRSVNMQWTMFEEDDSRRNAAIEQLEPMMKVGRVLISSAMGRAHECKSQFIHFGLVEQNGIAECISRFAELVPLSVWRANMEEQEIMDRRRRSEDAQLSAYLDYQGADALDSVIRTQHEAHFGAMSKVVNQQYPPMPGGLDG
jgi:hypothetical protein